MNALSASTDATKGRAIAARPLVCLLAIAGLGLIAAPAALAAPPTPVLTGTTPKSPNTTLTPLVKGSSTGIIISSFPGVSAAGMITAADDDPVIVIYEGVGCPGEPVAEGTAPELDGDGIEVTVLPESTTLFSARQTDESGSSGCSNAIQYQHVKELPPTEEPPPGGSPPGGGGGGPAGKPSPPRLRTIPGGWANDNTPLVTGSAPGADNVRIYADPECKGQSVAKGSVGQFSAGFKVTVVDNDVTVFSGVSVAGGEVSNCSAPILYVEDSMTPRTRITMGPAAKTAKRTAIFRFVDSTGALPGTVFRCKVDKRKWKNCVSPLKLKGLTRKPHLLRVKATDAAGNAERTGAKRRFKVIRRP
jgi:hypothetical protein